MLAIGHFVVGYSIVIVAMIFLGIKTRYGFLSAFAGGVWAMVPDVYWIDWFPVEYVPLMRHVHSLDWVNIFFFHRVLDLNYMDDAPTEVVIPILVAFLLTGIYSYVEIRRDRVLS